MGMIGGGVVKNRSCLESLETHFFGEMSTIQFQQQEWLSALCRTALE